MKRLEGSGWKISYMIIKKFQLQPLEVFTLKSEGFHSWINSSVFLNLCTQFNLILQDFAIATKWHHYCTAQTQKNIMTERQASDTFCSVRRTGTSRESRQLYESNWTLHSSVAGISKKTYETRTDKWHTSWIKPRVPPLGVDTEWDFHPVVSSFHQTYKANKKN